MKVVSKVVNLIKIKGFNKEFKEFLKTLKLNIRLYCEVKWLSKAKILKQFSELKEEMFYAY